jgi:hypothetical protein
MKMRQPELDVVLTDGEGYFVEDAPYQNHLKEFTDIKQVCIEVLIPRHIYPNHQFLDKQMQQA